MSYSARKKKTLAKVSGAEKIVERLKDMNDSAESVLMTAAKEGAKIALKDAVANCPEDTGALKSSLKITEGKSTNFRAEANVDYDKSLKYGTFVELGANGRPANPFLRNAVDDNIDKINSVVVDRLTKAVGSKM